MQKKHTLEQNVYENLSLRRSPMRAQPQCVQSTSKFSTNTPIYENVAQKAQPQVPSQYTKMTPLHEKMKVDNFSQRRAASVPTAEKNVPSQCFSSPSKSYGSNHFKSLQPTSNSIPISGSSGGRAKDDAARFISNDPDYVCMTANLNTNRNPKIPPHPIVVKSTHQIDSKGILLAEDCNQPLPQMEKAHASRASPSSQSQGVSKNLLPYSVTPPRPSGLTEAQRKIEELTRQLEEEIELSEEHGEYFGICHTCGDKVKGAGQACQAMGNLYHKNCFICCSCGRALRGKAFYNVHGRVYCEEDYMYSGFQQTAEKCAICGHLIMEMILQAMGKAFHPGCFRCNVCLACLDGVPFTVDADHKIYCVNDYHRMFAPKCASCQKGITPVEGSDETVRVVSMDKDFHVDCYICEECGMQLTDEPDKRCYPLEGRLLCRSCHLQNLALQSSPQSRHKEPVEPVCASYQYMG